jgi:NAD(P)H-dependent FMN reductase
MKVLAISGSGRTVSTHTAMLHAVSRIAAPDHSVTVFSDVATSPVFSPDHEVGALPVKVQNLVDLVRDNNFVIISSPEYVRSLPGGLKNAIDWLVSREEIITKPIALMHASHRGDDMLDQLRLILATVSQQFSPDEFLRFELMNLSPEEIAGHLNEKSKRSAIVEYLQNLVEHFR